MPDSGPRILAEQLPPLTGHEALVELHIEQGPVLESLELPLGVVLGSKGVERHAINLRSRYVKSRANIPTQFAPWGVSRRSRGS